eukprot:gene53650-5430_t
MVAAPSSLAARAAAARWAAAPFPLTLVENVGKLNPKHHCEMEVESITSRNIDQLLGTMTDSMVF